MAFSTCRISAVLLGIPESLLPKGHEVAGMACPLYVPRKSKPTMKLRVTDLAFEDEPSVEHVLYSWKDSIADFAHCLVDARNRRLGCEATATFDLKALQLAGFISVGCHLAACCQERQ
jgi:hypothetical protein